MLNQISFLLLLSFVFTATTSIAQSKKMNGEEMAIKEVIENESKYFWARDYKNWKKTWLQEDYVRWVVATRDGVTHHIGWKAWNDSVKALFEESPEPMEYNVKKTNYKFHISDDKDMAWVTFEQEADTKTKEIRIMEKKRGKWKIAVVEVIFDMVNENSEMSSSSTDN